MEGNFNFEIVSPERIILSENVSMVTLPSYEGDMSILKNHISIITFSGLMISSLKLSSIKQWLHPWPFFQLFQPLLQLYLPCKKQLQVNDHTHPYKWNQNLLL